MAIQSQPSRIPEPFAGSCTKNTIPATNATPSASQAASWASGFPPECSQPISAGGCPVPRNDVNGALNQITQDYAFRQDGGVWAWSALADYDTQRMVRGSDGLLYMSTAQSGPGVAAGAQDPTADDGTYWQAPYVKTMGALDSSAAAASTAWARLALNPADIYVDAATGSDANDGMTSAEAVKTIGQALVLGRKRTGGVIRLVVSSGTYVEDISIFGETVYISLQGNVVINGQISLEFSCLYIDDSIYTFSISYSNGSSALVIDNSSIAHSKSTINIDVTTGTGITLRRTSALFCEKAITLVLSSAQVGISCHDSSAIVFYAPLVITGSSVVTAIELQLNSIIYATSGITESNIASNNGLMVSSGSTAIFRGSNDFTFYSSGNYVVTFDVSSSLYCNISGVFSAINSGPSGAGYCISFGVNSSGLFEGNGTVSLVSTNGNRGLFRVNGGSYLNLNTDNLNCSGTVSLANAVVGYGSHLDFRNNATMTGTVTGRRYYMSYSSSIIVSGAGENVIPGATAGSKDASCYYG
jgi:hypothetical protein